MFHEQIAKITADHLRSHISAYLTTIQTEDTSIKLVTPKDIQDSSVVGGTISEFANILPQYGIDVLGKTAGEDSENLFTYNYEGQINGIVGGGSRTSVDKQCSRHARAVEYFIKQHRTMHSESNSNFDIIAFAFISLDFSGAEDLGTVNDRELWVAGFSINVVWVTSEDGVDQH